ncbi:hypothetical protein PORY_001493 [Pneumocystis oryctolagi]|uniref:Uncharacterized protein n=1 Tax=Pneumocystis oryctolagi TaxID=42067 RepID=A0ACB7CCL9_9ASCO|nr:hypothetical protein PORY_001493 [Pneumocystis oryctolagi]
MAHVMIEDNAVYALRSGKYYEALELFTKELKQRKTLSLLNGRAEAFEKIGEYENALNDSYKMIRFYPYNVKGYLRAGKILQLMNKYTKASRIYKHGIKCLSYDSKSSDLLRKMLRFTLKNIKKTRSLTLYSDFFQKIPVEIILKIFEYLSFKTISLCQRVSKSWRYTILSLNYLFYNLDFSYAKKCVSSKIILINIKRSQNLVRRIILNQRCVINDSLLLYMSKFCDNLTHLTLTKGFNYDLLPCFISSFSSLSSLILLYEIELSIVAQLISNAPNSLQKFEAKKLLINFTPFWNQRPTNIRMIKLIRADFSLCNNRVNFFNVNDMLKIIPNVRQIFLNNWVENLILDTYDFLHLDKLDVLDLSGSKFSHIPLISKSLVELNLSYLLGTDLSFSVLPRFECLRYLNLSYAPRLYPDTIISLTSSSACHLKELFLDCCPSLNINCIIDVILSCKLIEKLSLSGNSWVDNSLLIVIAHELKGLKYLNLSNCFGISGSGVIKLVNIRLSLIMHIVLNGCYNVSLDSVKWMRKLGINVDYKFETGFYNKLCES